MDSINLSSMSFLHENSSSEHSVLKNSPIYFKSLIGKRIKVELFNDTKHIGDVYCIDPVSESIVLVNKSSDKYDTDIILGYTVKKISVISEEINNDVIFQEQCEIYDENCEERKERIKTWLNQNMISVVEDGDSLIVGDDLTILPPYTVEKCLSTNTIVLERIQNILTKMPAQ